MSTGNDRREPKATAAPMARIDHADGAAMLARLQKFMTTDPADRPIGPFPLTRVALRDIFQAECLSR